MIHGGGACSWEPFTGVFETPERIPLALRDANMLPRFSWLSNWVAVAAVAREQY